jgi:hypothetical protein
VTCIKCAAVLVVGENWTRSDAKEGRVLCVIHKREQWNAAYHRRRARDPRRYKFEQKRRSCLSRGEPFMLAFEDVLWPETCPALGIPLDYSGAGPGRTGPRDNSPSFDRINPTAGYVAGNVAIISNRANSIKQNATAAELRAVADWCEAMSNRSTCEETDDH